MCAELIFEDIIYEIRNILDNQEMNLDINTRLETIGIDSFDYIKLLVSLEEKYQIEFDDIDLAKEIFFDLRELINKIKELSESKLL